MAVVFIRSLDGSTVISMDAVTSATYTRSATVSTSTMFNGSKRSDNVHSNLPIVTFTGVVTSTKIRDSYPSPALFRAFLDELIDSYEVMSFYGTEDASIPDLDNCYITSFDVTRDVEHSNGLVANVTLQQLDISNAVQATTITAPATEEVADNPDKASDGTKTEIKPVIPSTIGFDASGQTNPT